MGDNLRLRELRLNHFGKFHNATIPLKDGINLIYGDNEAGKTTIHSFLRGMLFGIERLRGRASKDDPYLKYQPWDSPGAYNGSLVIDINEKGYRILRNFDKNTKNYSIIELDTGRELNLKPEELKDFYGGLTEAGYRNTISVEQLRSGTDNELIGEVRNYITNLTLSKSKEINITKALSFLNEIRKKYDLKRIDQEIAQLESDIEYGLENETKIDQLTVRLKEVEEKEKLLLNNRNKADRSIEAIEGFDTVDECISYMDEFPVVKEKYKNYRQLQNELKEQQEKLVNTKIEIQKLEKIQVYYNELKNRIAELDKTKSELASLEDNRKKDADTLVRLSKSKGKYVMISLIFAIILSILVTSIFGFNARTIASLSIVVVASLFLFSSLSKKDSAELKELQTTQNENDKMKVQLEHKLKRVLSQSNMRDELELKDEYEKALRQTVLIDHRKVDYDKCIQLIQSLEFKVKNQKEKIINYIGRFPQVISAKVRDMDIILDTTMMELEKYIINQKQILVNLQQEFTRENELCILQKEKIKWELEALEGNEAELLQNRERYKEFTHQKQKAELELSAIKLATDTINDISIDIHNSFGSELNKLVSSISCQITKNKYENVKVDEKLNVKVGYKDNYVTLDKLSSGTIGQLYLALRLSISDLVYGNGTMPILLDDSFALYDDKRTKAALETLIQNENRQILIFTCHTREKNILDQMQVGYNYIELK